MTMQKQFDRFDFEQGIMQCWNMVDDVQLLSQRGAPTEDFEGVCRLYQHKFEELWAQFENGIEQKRIA